ncbi:MAG TPA: hypothetical protein VFL97_06345 [Nitrococcus sp.]|nr:hypothetical protein [Nitrococcus sp.]
MERTLLGKPDLLYLKALIDLGRIDEAKSLIERDLIANAHGDFIERSAWYISVLSGERPPPLLRDGKFRLGDERFLQLVQGKSVAVVGPLNNGEGNGAEIDEFDIVVRTNCFTWQNNVQSDKGSRLDVAYYNGEAAALLKRTPEDVPECRFMVLKAFDEELQKRYENLRTLISVDLFFSGSINAIPNVVYDLIRFSPSRIKVFNADLMLSYKYRKGYVDAINFSIAHSLDEALDSFFAHEPAQQFRALHLLWERGLIEGDRVFNSVMALGLTGYLEKLTGRLYETTLGGSGKR